MHAAVVAALVLGYTGIVAAQSPPGALPPPARPELNAPSTEPPLLDRPLPQSTMASEPLDPTILLSSDAPESRYWWESTISQALDPEARWVRFDLATILADTLEQSPQIQAVLQQPVIAAARVVEADAAFDPAVLLDSGWGRTSDPAGNSLLTGGPPRLRESDWTSRLGMRGLSRRGGQWEISQQATLLSSNSVFFFPPSQGNTRLEVSLNQPLMANSGQVFNQRLVLGARLDSRVAHQQALLDIQNRLAKVMVQYWELYEARCRWAIQADLLRRGRELERIVSGRRPLDTGHVEQVRAREQVALRRTRVTRARVDAQNAQTQLSVLVGAAALETTRLDELIPQGFPRARFETIALPEALVTGLHHRPEIAAAAADVEQAALEINVSRNQLMPRLDAVVNGYVSGLNGNQDIGGSLLDQFTVGEPGFFAGLEFELPVGRRAATARYRGARATYQQRVQQMRQAILDARGDIEIALREVKLAKELTLQREQTMQAALTAEKYLRRRWELLGGDGTPAGLVLQDVLEAQQSRAEAENALVEAQVGYMQAFVQLQLAMGTLLIGAPADALADVAEPPEPTPPGAPESPRFPPVIVEE